MTNTQLFFAITGIFIAGFGLVSGLFYKYIDAKFDYVDRQLKFIVDHIVTHIEKIAKLEERTKNL